MLQSLPHQKANENCFIHTRDMFDPRYADVGLAFVIKLKVLLPQMLKVSNSVQDSKELE